MQLNVCHVHIVYCIRKPRLDFESAHQAGRFEYKNIPIGQIEVAMSSASINSVWRSGNFHQHCIRA